MIRYEDLTWTFNLPTDEKTIRTFRLLSLLKSLGLEKCVDHIVKKLPETLKNRTIPSGTVAIFLPDKSVSHYDDEIANSITMILDKYLESKKYKNAEDFVVELSFCAGTMNSTASLETLHAEGVKFLAAIAQGLERTGYTEESSKMQKRAAHFELNEFYKHK